MRGLFVTGTDTEAGKTIVAAAIVAALVADGLRVAAFKPAVTGLDEPAADPWPRDHELLAALTGADPTTVTADARSAPPSRRTSPPSWPERRSTPRRSSPRRARPATEADALIVEGVGGLLVPLTMGYAIRDFALDLGLGLVIAARPGLGTINHTLLTLESARGAGLTVRAVVLGPWPVQPSAIEVSNRDTIAALGRSRSQRLTRFQARRRWRPPERDWRPGAGCRRFERRPPRWIASRSMTTDELRAADRAVLWHPFTQMQRLAGRGRADHRTRAQGATLWDTDGNAYIDGISSLWCNVHGHRHPHIDAAVRDQLDRVAHSTMLGLSHRPAIELAQRLVDLAPGRPEPRLLLGLRLDGGRGGAEDGLPVVGRTPASRSARSSSA